MQLVSLDVFATATRCKQFAEVYKAQLKQKGTLQREVNSQACAKFAFRISLQAAYGIQPASSPA